MFKIGDKVKVINVTDSDRMHLNNTIGTIIEDTGPRYRWLLDTSDWLFTDEELELVEHDLKHIDINSMYASQMQTIIDNTTYGTFESFSQLAKKLLDVVNPREEKKMDKFELINLYYKTKKTEIENNCEQQLKSLDEQKSELATQVDNILNQTNELLTELYMSQFTKEELEEFNKGLCIDMSNKELRREGNIQVSCNLKFNSSIKNDERLKFIDARNEEIEQLQTLVDKVKAHLSICENKTEIEQVLTTYKIMRAGKLDI